MDFSGSIMLACFRYFHVNRVAWPQDPTISKHAGVTIRSSSVGITQVEVLPGHVINAPADYSALKRSTQVRTTAIAERLTLRPYVHIRDAAFHTYL